MATYDKNENYVEMWEAARKSTITTMYQNLSSDLSCGYDPLGSCVKRQQDEIANYISKYHEALDKFVYMTDEQTNKWCFYDMKKRGDID